MGHKDMNIKFKTIIVTLLTFSLTGCWMSEERKQEIASVTCSIINETRNMDSAIRVEKINDAREELNARPYLDGDDKIRLAVGLGQCKNLVLGTEESLELVNKAILVQAASVAQAKESSAWDMALSSNKIDNYKDFIKNYPNSEFKDQASNNIVELEAELEKEILAKEQERQIKEQERQKRKIEASAYKVISGSYEIAPLQNYINTYPNSKYINQAKKRIGLIKAGMSDSANGFLVQEKIKKLVKGSTYATYPGYYSDVKLKHNVITLETEGDKKVFSNRDRDTAQRIAGLLEIITRLSSDIPLTINVDIKGARYTTVEVEPGTINKPFSSIELNRVFNKAVAISGFNKQLIAKKTGHTVLPTYWGQEYVLSGTIRNHNENIVFTINTKK